MMLRGGDLSADFRAGEVEFRLPGAKPLRMRFPGSNTASPEPLDPSDARVSHIAGTPVGFAAWSAIRYRDLYTGTDLIIRGRGTNLKSEFVLQPGADPARIRISYSGKVRIDGSGELVIEGFGATFRESRPLIYQQLDTTRVAVNGGYQLLQDGSVGFQIDAYDRNRTLVIDPSISYSTHLGGSRFEAATAVAADAAGNAYVAGWTESPDLPASAGFQHSHAGSVDAFVAKIDPAGHLVYCTYLGGAGDDRAFGVAVDGNGSVYVVGSTTSRDFPIKSAFQQVLRGRRDGFAARLSAAGTELLYSTYLGGTGDDTANGIALDSSGNAYIAGETNSPDFPILQAVQHSLRGLTDAFIVKLSPSGSELFGTYFGGTADDRAAAIATDGSGAAWIAGGTTSWDFPLAGALQTNLKGSQDAFVAKIDITNRSVLYSTYLGGSGGTIGFPETATAIAVDSTGAAFVAGRTSSTDFPLVAPLKPFLGGETDAFVTKINPWGTGLIYSTYLGGTGLDTASGIAVDALGRADIVGWTSSTDFPVTSAAQPSNRGGYDMFLVRLSTAGNSLAYGTYLGGSDSDAANGVALAGGSIVVSGQSLSHDFPAVNPLQAVDFNNFAATVTKFSENTSSRFFPVTPCRVMDTRADQGKAGPFGPPAIPGGTFRDVPIPLSDCEIPSTAAAYSLNITVLPRGPLGYLIIWPAGTAVPRVSTLNSYDGRVIANAAIVPAGMDGAVSVKVSDTADIIIDVNGYFAGATAQDGYVFHALTPCRVMDTRTGQGKSGPFGPPTPAGGTVRDLPVSESGCGVPPSAAAYSLNITVLPAGYFGHLITWPTGLATPRVSTLNAWLGNIVSNAAIVPAGVGGAVSVLVSDRADVLVDINGYFSPPAAEQSSGFHPVTPCRVMDTRMGQGKTGAFGPPSFAAGSVRSVPVPASGCGIPKSAIAYSVNFTVLPAGYLGYLITWPAGIARPGVSTLNSWDGSLVVNAAIVPAGDNGAVNVLVSDAAEVIVDINGYFGP